MQSDLNAAYLWAQLEVADEINNDRLKTWNTYHDAFLTLVERGLIELPTIPDECVHNAHMFYIKCKDLDERTKFINKTKELDIGCVFHYIPLHSAPAGIKFGRFDGRDIYTTSESDRLVRLPMYYKLSNKDLKFIIDSITAYFS